MLHHLAIIVGKHKVEHFFIIPRLFYGEYMLYSKEYTALRIYIDKYIERKGLNYEDMYFVR